MSRCVFDEFSGPNNTPARFPYGYSLGTGAASNVNNIGVPGQQGFGVGICPGPLPAGMVKMAGTEDGASDNYGNYRYSDGSIMIWRPAHWVKWGTGVNGLAVNALDLKSFDYFVDVATAAASGYMLPQSFYNAGAIQPGYFRDKYIPSNNAGTASSLKGGAPLSTSALHNPIAALTGAPANFYYGVVAAAKSRGANFFPATVFMKMDSARISYAHGRAATSAAWCAWRDGTLVANFPKGCNNNALGDAQDASILYQSDGYGNSGRTGSANLFSRTTDNGQNCGFADENGLMWEVVPGLTTDDAGTTYYTAKTSVDWKSVTGGNTLATDLWGAAGLAALYTALGATYGALTASASPKTIGNAAQVYSEATSGLAWQAACAGIPLVTGVGGANAYGNDGLWDYRPGALCPVAGGSWADASAAGVWALNCSNVRGTSGDGVGFRAALYL